MLTFILLLAALRPSLSILAPSSPASANGAGNSSALLQREELPPAIELPGGTRNTEDILWSCLATIFACVWVAVHPNIPGPRDSPWLRFRQRCMTMFYAIIAPEMMTLWAMRQQYAAARIKKEYNQKYHGYVGYARARSCGGFIAMIKGWFHSPDEDEDEEGLWTLSHGFYIQMRGFLFAEDGKPRFVITFNKLQELVRDGAICRPSITAEDILDKSKGDLLTKTLVITQTTWFIVQCIVRWAAQLEVTELEVVTLAFAFLNIITYALWWHKPQNVQVATLIPKRYDAPSLEPGPPESRRSWLERNLTVEEGDEENERWLPWIILVTLLLPIRLLRGLFVPLGRLATEDQVVSGSTRVPVFYAERSITEEPKVIFPALAMSVIFGGIHLSSWTSPFPSGAERLLWRISATAITFEPLPVAIGAGLYKLHGRHRVGKLVKRVMEAVAMSLASIGFIGVPVYILARMMLLVLAFTTLRGLGSKAFADLQWSSYVPHI